MQIHQTLSEISLPAAACAIGLFDGIHIGHMMVLGNALREAQKRNIPSVVVSFADHPQVLTSKTPTQLVSDPDERLAHFEALGFDHALVPPFDSHLKSIPADTFIEDVLKAQLNVKSVTVGYDHRFGRDRFGDGNLLKKVGERDGFSVHIIDPVRIITEESPQEGDIVSSTLIRKLLSKGNITMASRLLARSYTLGGLVTSGVRRGRQLGFPTANLLPNSRRLIPASGTYAGWAQINESGPMLPAVCNIGLSPTFGDQAQKRVEVHLLDYDGPAFYGERLTMFFLDRIRDERKFGSVDELIAQIQADCAITRTMVTDQAPDIIMSSPKTSQPHQTDLPTIQVHSL